MDVSGVLNKKLYLLDGSFISGVTPYVNIDSVMKHPLWGSNLLFNTEEAVVNGHKDYIRGQFFIVFRIKRLYILICVYSWSRILDYQHIPSER